MRTAFVVLGLSLVLAPVGVSSPAEARCMQMGLAPEILNPDRELAADAALVVRLVPAPSSRPRTNAFPALTLSRNGTSIPLRLEKLTPSLARYVPARRPDAGTWQIAPLGREVTFGARSAVGLATPRVTSARSVASTRGRRGSEYTVDAVLERPAPRRAVAVFAEHDSGAFGDGNRVGTRTSITIFNWRTRCLMWPEGMAPPPTDGAARLRFVGGDGQLSRPSNPVAL